MKLDMERFRALQAKIYAMKLEGDNFDTSIPLPGYKSTRSIKGKEKCASWGQEQLARTIESWGYTVIRDTWDVIHPHQLDIYIPELSAAVEYNGLQWHSDEHLLITYGLTASEYHQRKLNECKKKDLRLAYVWSDDYTRSRAEVLASLKAFLTEGTTSPVLTRLEP